MSDRDFSEIDKAIKLTISAHKAAEKLAMDYVSLLVSLAKGVVKFGLEMSVETATAGPDTIHLRSVGELLSLLEISARDKHQRTNSVERLRDLIFGILERIGKLLQRALKERLEFYEAQISKKVVLKLGHGKLPAKEVLNRISYLLKELGIQEVHFEGENLSLDDLRKIEDPKRLLKALGVVVVKASIDATESAGSGFKTLKAVGDFAEYFERSDDLIAFLAMFDTLIENLDDD